MESEDEIGRAVEAIYERALAGDAEAQLEVARNLTHSEPADSLKFYRQAAESGLTQAQYELAARLLTERRELEEAVRQRDSSEPLSNYQSLTMIAVGPEFDEAFQWLQKASSAGHRDAQYTLGSLYTQVKDDQDAAREWYLKAAESGHPHAQYQMGLACAMEGVADDAKWFQAAAEQGHSEAAFLFAAWLVSNRQPTQAAEWYRKALESGHEKSEFELGYLLATQLEQPEEGARLIRRAAQRGEMNAQRNLAAMYGMGHGVPQDESQAAHWYRLSAEQGHPESQFRMGLMLHLGNVLPADPGEARRWLRLAAEQGHERAQSLLTELLEESDPEEALKWFEFMAARDPSFHDNIGVLYLRQGDKRAVHHFRLAAESGDLSGMYNLGVMYFQGELIEKDEETALALFRKAANAGLPRACHNMGALLEETDLDEALEYYREAARLGVPQAQARLAVLEPESHVDLSAPETTKSDSPPIIRVCELIISQSIIDGSEAFRIRKGLVQFFVDQIWHDVMSPPEHITEPVFQRFREMAEMGIEDVSGEIQITLDDDAEYKLGLKFKDDVLEVQIAAEQSPQI